MYLKTQCVRFTTPPPTASHKTPLYPLRSGRFLTTRFKTARSRDYKRNDYRRSQYIIQTEPETILTLDKLLCTTVLAILPRQEKKWDLPPNGQPNLALALTSKGHRTGSGCRIGTGVSNGAQIPTEKMRTLGKYMCIQGTSS
jgi:hypothetical protein